MQVSCVALAGQPLSCRPNRGGKLKSPSPPPIRWTLRGVIQFGQSRTWSESNPRSGPQTRLTELVAAGGERNMNDAVHAVVHPSVHLSDEPKLRGILKLRMTQQLILDAGKTPDWAGATPLCCHGNRGGRSSPVGIRHKEPHTSREPLAARQLHESAFASHARNQSVKII